MAITEEKEYVSTLKKERTKYLSSDGRKFLDKSEAVIHEGYLKWNAELKRRNVCCINNAYYCRNKTDYDAVTVMLAYKHGCYNWAEGKWTPFFYYKDNCFVGEDWYFFEHGTNKGKPDDYWVETLTEKKVKFQEFEEWIHLYESESSGPWSA